VSGLSPKTVARLRSRATVDSAQSRARVGRDGRLRPVDPAEVRRRVAEAVRSDPEASTRAIAARTGASQATVRDVRERLDRGVSELIPRPRRARKRDDGVPDGPEPDGVMDAPGEDDDEGEGKDEGEGADAPAVDRAAAGPEGGADFPTWFEQHRIDDADWERFVHGLPISRVYEVADACRRFSAAWRAFAVALEDRARTHRRSSPTSDTTGETTGESTPA
jgi:hypothetical protein